MLVFFNGIFPENGSKTMDCSIVPFQICPHDSTCGEGKELHQSHGRPHHYPDSGDMCWFSRAPGLHTFSLSQHVKGPARFGRVMLCKSSWIVWFTSGNRIWAILRIHPAVLFSPFLHQESIKISIATCCGSFLQRHNCALTDFLTDPIAPHFLR